MAEESRPTLMEASIQFNIKEKALLDFLFSRGFDVAGLKPTSKITEEMYRASENEFKFENAIKLRRGEVNLPKDSFTGSIDKWVEERIKNTLAVNSDFLDLGDLGFQSIPHSILLLKDTLKTLVLGNKYVDNDNQLKYSSNSRAFKTINNLEILSSFTRLENLFLENIHISNIEILSTFIQLKKLDISGQNHTSLGFLRSLSNLTYLDISGNPTKYLDDVFVLDSLQCLRASNCSLNSLPGFDPGVLKNLKMLNLSNNPNIRYSLNKLRNLHNLKELFLENNSLDDSIALPLLKHLELLSVKDNEITNGKIVKELTGLKFLNLSNNMISDISFIINFKGLIELVASNNGIEILPRNISLPRLEILVLSKNLIRSISPNASFPAIKILDLSFNKLKNITSFASSTALQYLSLSNNEITGIESLWNLHSIKVLDLSCNNIEDLSPLKELMLTNKYTLNCQNYFDERKVITDFFQRDTLSFKNAIFIAENPISNPPQQYLFAGAEAVLNYWAQEQKASEQNEIKKKINEAKLIIVGNSNTGKSTLAWYFKHGVLPEVSLPSTHGMEFLNWSPGWTINNESFSVNIIDFGGQEYYHDTHHLFFNNKAAYLLLWNASTNKNAKFETPVKDRSVTEIIRHFYFEYWLNAIDIYCDVNPENPSPVLLVQTRTDTEGKKHLNLENLSNKYPQLFGSIAVSLNKDNPLNLDLLKLEIKNMYAQIHGNFMQEYYESWINIKTYIEENFKDHFKICTIKEFTDLFNANSGTASLYTEAEVVTVCITLNYWGVVLYKYEIAELNNFVIINPQAFTRKINEFLSEDLRKNEGIISIKDVQNKIGINKEKAEEVLAYLKYFKIIFELPQKSANELPQYISPMYLNEQPKYLDLLLGGFEAYYKIVFDGYFHKGILLDCFAELGKNLYFDNGHYLYWQWGMVLKRDGTMVSVEFDKENLNHILIKTMRKSNESIGNNPFIKDIFEAFKKITNRYKVSVQLSLDGIDYIDKSLILTRLKYGFNKIEWDGKVHIIKNYLFLFRHEELPSYEKRIFVSYSSKDRQFVDELKLHLDLYKNTRSFNYWIDWNMKEDAEWNPQILDEMAKANVLIMLLSPGYLSTPYIIEKEIPIALQYQAAAVKEKQVFWLLLKPCNYEAFSEISKYPVYPIKEYDSVKGVTLQKAISEYPNRDRKWVELLKFILDEEG